MTIATKLSEVQSRLALACDSCGRDPLSVTLVAVTKTVPVQAIQEAYDAGQRHFGESRLQEALPKIAALPQDIVWHFIGRLQSNKARRVAECFDVVHTLENERQLAEAAKAKSKAAPLDVLVEVNVADEPQKAGVLPVNLDRLLQGLLICPNVRFRGLMTIGPEVTDPEQSRPVFRALRSLGQQVGAEWLSMGMSADAHVAIQEGATHVRIGSAIFGERD